MTIEEIRTVQDLMILAEEAKEEKNVLRLVALKWKVFALPIPAAEANAHQQVLDGMIAACN